MFFICEIVQIFSFNDEMLYSPHENICTAYMISV